MKICGMPYKVSVVSKIADANGKALIGSADFDHGKIIISEDQLKQKQKETLLHEVTHCILHHTGHKQSEKICDAVANGLLQLGVGDYVWEKHVKEK